MTPPTSGAALQSLDEVPNSDEALVVWSEQGMGDVIQFCRYLYLLEASISFVFLTRPCLVSLVREWTGFGERVQSFGTFDSADDKGACSAHEPASTICY